MLDDNYVNLMKLNNGRIVSLFMSAKNDLVTLIQKKSGATHQLKIIDDAVNTRRWLLESWAYVGVRPTYMSWVPIGPGKFWWSEQFKLMVTFIQGFWRERLDLGDGIDEHYETAWYVEMSKTMDELAEHEDTFEYGINGRQFSEDFIAAITQGLWDYGFQDNTPLRSYSPTGEWCNQFNWQVWGKRMVVKNMRFRDV